MPVESKQVIEGLEDSTLKIQLKVTIGWVNEWITSLATYRTILSVSSLGTGSTID